MSARLISVFGATGQQGGAVARALLGKGGFVVRAITRNPDSEKALALKKSGAEIVKGDLEDKSTLDAAVAGSYGVFLVTNYWDLLARLKNADLAQAKSSSGLQEAKDAIGHPVPHFDTKALVERYLDEIGLPNTCVRYAAYYDNFTSNMKANHQSDGTLAITLPMDGPMYGVSVEDGGAVVASVFSLPDEFIGRKFGIAGDSKTLEEYIAVINKVTGKNIQYNKVPVEVFASFPFPGADDLAYMFEFYMKGNPYYDETLTRRLNPNALRFEEWAESNKDKF
ncbi:hypothetical protein EMCRGX_G029332 [Ephydatia muelleri]